MAIVAVGSSSHEVAALREEEVLVSEVDGGDLAVGTKETIKESMVPNERVVSVTVSSMYWIKRGVLDPIPLQLEYPSGIVDTWADWIDKELVDNEFVEVLQEAEVFEAIVISWGLNMYCDVVGTRHLVRKWCLATHTFFLACGEFTVTIEDVANLLMLPILGDVDPTRFRLTTAEFVIEEELIKGYGG
ncbi:hypothetical protein FCV25MIE_18745 [Fagus crenata]